MNNKFSKRFYESRLRPDVKSKIQNLNGWGFQYSLSCSL